MAGSNRLSASQGASSKPSKYSSSTAGSVAAHKKIRNGDDVSAKKPGKRAAVSHEPALTTKSTSVQVSHERDGLHHQRFIHSLRHAVASCSACARHSDPVGADLHFYVEGLTGRGGFSVEDIEHWLSVLRSVLVRPLRENANSVDKAGTGGEAGSSQAPAVQCAESMADRLSDDTMLEQLLEALPLPSGHTAVSSQIWDEAQRLIVAAITRRQEDSDVAEKLHRICYVKEYSLIADEKATEARSSASTRKEHASYPPLVEAGNRHKGHGDGSGNRLSSDDTPRDSFVASRIPVRCTSSMAGRPVVRPVRDQATPSQQPRSGRPLGNVTNAQPRRSLSVGSVPSRPDSRVHHHHDEGSALLELLKTRQNGPPSVLSVNEYGEYTPSRSHPMGRMTRDASIPITAPLDVRPKRSSTCSSLAPPLPQMSAARKRPVSSTFGTTNRPDPFAPKPEHSFRLNNRPAIPARLRPRMEGIDNRRGMSVEPAPQSLDQRTTTPMMTQHLLLQPSPASRDLETPEVPAWKRLAQQHTNASEPKKKSRQCGDDAAASKTLHDESTADQDLFVSVDEPSAEDSRDQTPEEKVKMADTTSTQDLKKSRQSSNAAIDLGQPSEPVRSATLPAALVLHQINPSSYSNRAGLLLRPSDRQLAIESTRSASRTVPTAGAWSSRRNRASIQEIENALAYQETEAARIQSEEGRVQERARLGIDAPPRHERPSLLKVNIKIAKVAFKKGLGGLSKTFQGLRTNPRARRRSLDSLTASRPEMVPPVDGAAIGQQRCPTNEAWAQADARSSRRSSLRFAHSPSLGSFAEEDEDFTAEDEPSHQRGMSNAGPVGNYHANSATRSNGAHSRNARFLRKSRSQGF